MFFSKIAGNGGMVWSKSIGDSTTDAYVYALQPTADGGFAAVTLRGANLSLQQSGVMKLSQDGQLVWYRYLPGSLTETPVLLDLVCNPDGSMAACGYGSTGGFLVVKFDPNGNLAWEKHYQAASGSWQTVLTITNTPDNGYVIAGYSHNNNNTDAILLKLDANGTIVWNKILTSVHKNFPLKVKVLADGNILLAGYMIDAGSDQLLMGCLTKLSPDGALLWSKRIRFSDNTESLFFDFEEGPGAYFTAVGKLEKSSSPVANTSAGIFRFDSTGQIQWAKKYDNIQDGYFIDMAVAPGSSFYIMGDDNSDQSGVWYARLIKADAAGFTGECLPEVLIPQTEDISINVFSETYTLQPLPPIDSAMLPVFDVALEIDTLCAPECYVSPELCNNNLDDDGDGLFDCLDPDCNCPEDECNPGQANIWYFGDHAGLDFSAEPPTVLTDGQTKNVLGSAVMCDAQGNLLFYSDGNKVFNRFHEPMPNGDNLSPTPETIVYEAIAIPHPGKTGLYYLFAGRYDGEVWYSLIDMKADGGKGDVVTGEKSVQIADYAFDMRLTATRSCAFDGYWLILKADDPVGTYQSYRIDENGLNLTPVIGTSGLSALSYSQMKCSPDGHKLATVVRKIGQGLFLELSDFDTGSGLVSGKRTFKIPSPIAYGIEFSPNSRYLYMSLDFEERIIQLDLEAGDSSQIMSSLKEVAFDDGLSGYFYSGLQLAPNGKIYVGQGNPAGLPSSSVLHVIHQPDQPGTACQFQQNGQPLAGNSSATYGLVNIVQSYFAQPANVIRPDAQDTICILDSLYTYTVEKSGCFQTDSTQWKLEGLPGTLYPEHSISWVKFDAPGEGNLIYTAYTACGTVSDTLRIVVTEPFDKTLDLGPDRIVCDNGVFTFNAGSGFTRYRWQDGAPDSVLTTLLPGQYWVDVW
ncbi:MAG TPA: hypothetical protein PK228_19960, partial [Saprospiraceae bacterium]|nr:hypothetical protein [Saprospiraceae bacterium]